MVMPSIEGSFSTTAYFIIPKQKDLSKGILLLVTPAGFEPAIFWMKTRCPEPLDDGALVGLEGIEPSTPCLKGKCSTTELQTQV